MVERLIIAFPFWAIGIAYLAIRRHYSPVNLLMVAGGTAFVMAALAVNPDDGVVISLAALGGGLWVMGFELEKRHTRERQRNDQQGAANPDGRTQMPG